MTFDDLCFNFTGFIVFFWLYLIYLILVFLVLEFVWYVIRLIIRHSKNKKSDVNNNGQNKEK